MGTEIVMSHLGILVTTYCNLNCRDCADLIPKRVNSHYDFEDIKKDLSKILDAVSMIEEVLIIGGETLLYPCLEDVIDFCAKQDKVKKVIITSNGTMRPTKELLRCIQKNDVLVRISGYPLHVAPRREEIIEELREEGIAIDNLQNMNWLKIDDCKVHMRTEEEMKRIFSTCTMKNCVALNREGKIFFCSRQMTAYETNLYPSPEATEYIDVRQEDDLALKLRNFYKLPYISTCEYCDGISCVNSKLIPSATQILDKSVFLELVGFYNCWKYEGLSNEEEIYLLNEIITIIMEYNESFLGLDSYDKFVETLQMWENVNTDFGMQSAKKAFLDLINEMAHDYNYNIVADFPFLKSREINKLPNTIVIGNPTMLNCDILISEDDIWKAVNEEYPIVGEIYNGLFIESKLQKITHTGVKCIVCGLSYTQYGLLENKMPVETVNLSIIGQDIPYSIMMARKALEYNEKVETIIIPMTYYQGFYDISADDAQLHINVMNQINIPIFKDMRNFHEVSCEKDEGNVLAIYDIIFDLESCRDLRDEYIRKELTNAEYFNGLNSCGMYGSLKFDFKNLSEDEKYSSARITAEHNERICSVEGYKEVVRYLAPFLDEMNKLNKKIIFFVPPMTRYLYSEYHQELKDVYYNRFVSMFGKYSNVIFLDLASDSRFEEKDFLDFEHLSSSGAVKLTEILGKCVLNQDDL